MELATIDSQNNDSLLTSSEMDQKIYEELKKIPVQQDIRQSYGAYAADANPLVQKAPSRHIRSLIATLILFSGIGTMMGLAFSGQIYISLGGLIGACVGIYIFYLMLALICNPLFSYFSNVEHGMNFEAEYNNVRKLHGQFCFFAECYHYETRFHTRTVTDGNGNTRV